MTTSRLSLPLLVAGQAQKEIAHNEALVLLDGCVAACVEQRALASPPASPVSGACYIVAAGASGAWVGKVDQLAIATDGGWRFVVAREGLRAVVASEGIEAIHRGAAGWDYGTVRATGLMVDGTAVVGPRRPAISDTVGGSTNDTQARATISSILSSLRAHGLIEP